MIDSFYNMKSTANKRPSAPKLNHRFSIYCEGFRKVFSKKTVLPTRFEKKLPKVIRVCKRSTFKHVASFFFNGAEGAKRSYIILLVSNIQENAMLKLVYSRSKSLFIRGEVGGRLQLT